MSAKRGVLLALAAIALLTVVFSAKGVLQDIHWDAPIYLQRARVFVETPYLREFAVNASAIAADLHHFKADQGVSTPYWSFIRLGNTILLGGVTAMVGPGTASVHAAFWLYIALLSAAVLLLAETALRLMRLMDAAVSEQAAVAGALLSAALYLASDACRHLAGNFVAEVPALFLLAASLLTLHLAVTRRSLLLGAASGLLAFLMYVVKVDAIWAWLGFVALLALALSSTAKDRAWLPALIAAAVAAAAGYLAYAFLFWPLPDPRLLLLFQRAHDESPPNAVEPVKLLIAAGGLLWAGLGLGLRYAAREKAFWLAAAWLALVVLPFAPALLDGRASQVRVFALTMAPLLFASTIGCAAFFDLVASRRVPRFAPWLLGALIVGVLAVSHHETYSALRQFPGGWRLQYVRQWLSPPQYERLSYPLADIARLSAYLYADAVPKLLVIDRPKNAELASLVSVLRPTANAGLTLPGTSAKVFLCGREHDFTAAVVSSCGQPPTEEEILAAGGRVRVLYLQRLDGDLIVDHPLAGTVVFRSGPLSMRAWKAVGG